MSRGARQPAAYDPPGSRADPADHERAEKAWRDFCARIDAEKLKLLEKSKHGKGSA